ncbi:hypothetical protein, variant [Fonticula alba]|uniref:diacylglycerol O-acyltransferase n=1 Tax=Fonticula alba TaxID=691883 RepID=A0A058Z5V4_FONAL|nr:hypothetical protein, variant [Fonticula alba]KCV69650.1 hypothetical protein, variant [Fonticula alba]|eukprot:XP_009496215.1 hypothetical protein, variant [Fonticula alba]
MTVSESGAASTTTAPAHPQRKVADKGSHNKVSSGRTSPANRSPRISDSSLTIFHRHSPKAPLMPFLLEAWVKPSVRRPLPDVKPAPVAAPGPRSQHPPSYLGWIRLAILGFALLALRDALDSIVTHGWLTPMYLFTNFARDLVNIPGLLASPSVQILFSFNLFVLAGWLIQRTAHSIYEKTGRLHTGLFFTLRALLSCSCLAFTTWAMVNWDTNICFNAVNIIIMASHSAKLWSYGAVNDGLRLAAKMAETDPTNTKYSQIVADKLNNYPKNLTLGDAFYFSLAPTLCYQPIFPRTQSINWSFVALRFVEFLFFCALEVFLALQLMQPALQGSIVAFEQGDYLALAARILHIMVPNMLIWLVGFYAYFHVFLNMTSELLRFSDRQFFSDWWNATTVAYFWRSWNGPVHNFIVAHVYLPLQESGAASRVLAGLLSFIISALAHEALAVVPLGLIGKAPPYAMLAMLAQPLAVVATARMKKTLLGSLFFWSTLIIGQPAVVFLYFIAHTKAYSA